jgi:hypothetical protein
MGAFNTKYEKSEEAEQKKFNINDFEVNKLKDDEELFNNIIKISKDLYTTYHMHFLNENFCKQLSTIYKKKLFQLNINSLQNIHNKISNKNSNSNSKLEAVLSYTPSNQDTFIVNEFKTQLQEHLWNHEMDLNPQIFANKGIILDDIPMTIVDPQNKLRYINIGHVNDLLSNSIKELKNNKEEKKETNNKKENQVGGANNNSSSSSYTNSSSPSYSESQSESNKNFSRLRINKKNRLFENRNNFENNTENNQLLNENQNIQINNLKKKIQKANKNFGLNLNNMKNTNNMKNLNNIKNTNNIKNLNNMKNNKNNSNIKFLVNNNLQQFLNQIPNNGKKIEIINNQKQNHKQNQNQKVEKFNKKVQYQVRNYQTPTTFCGNSESCKMNKNQLCKAISEHFIVRGNIIASILSTLPRKTNSGFEGGYCYQRFLNLDKCQVCLPHNYNELMSMDTKSRIQTMMLFINYMTEKECNENKGLFRKLSLGEKKSLILHGREGNDFNLLYTEYTNNVRVKYIEHLNILLEILNTLSTMEGINNEELNALSLKTKETIDSMYHLCQFYYLYAIIALLNANITPIKREENNEKNKIKSNMKQFLATV